MDAATWVAIGSLGTCASAVFVAYQSAVASRALRGSVVEQRQAMELSLRQTAAQVWLSAEISHYGLWNESADPAAVFPAHGIVGSDLLIRAYVRAIADGSQTWRWELAEPPPWQETSARELYCGYQLVPVSRRITGSELLRLPGQE
jgi:hypothetical protein